MTEEPAMYDRTLSANPDLSALTEAYCKARDDRAAMDLKVKRAETELTAALALAGVDKYQSDERHLTVNVSTRRTVKVHNEQEVEFALTEVGVVVPRKMDTAALRKVLDANHWDIPGCEIVESEPFLTVRASKS